jgi:tetratricopeptide (TPR) repeat protein
VVSLARLRLFEDNPDWGDSSALKGMRSKRIDLSPLTPQASNQLLDEILSGIGELPTAIRKAIVFNAEGNPFYLEELVQVLIDDNVIVYDPNVGDWEIDPNLGENLRIPATLTAVLQARLDSLPAIERRTLQQASVVGRIFWDALLREIEDMDRTPDQELDALSQRRLVIHQSVSGFSETNEFAFKHAILRDVTYETLLKRDRKRYHGKVARWMEKITRASGRLAEYQALIAGHYEQAGESASAAQNYEEAGKLALKQGASQEARHLFERAIQLIPTADAALRFQILLGLSEVLGVLGENERRLELIIELIELGKTLGNAEQAEAYYRFGFFQYSRGNCHDALETFDLALEAADAAGDSRIQVLCSTLRLICLGMIGDRKAAQESAKTVLERINVVDEITAAHALVNLAVYYLQSGELVEAARLFSQQAQITSKLGNLRYSANALTNLGYTYVLLGFFAEARQSLDQSLQVHRSIGERNMEGYDLLNRGLALWRIGDFTQACEDFKLAECLLKETDDTYGLTARQVYLGLVEESRGDFFLARKLFGEAFANFGKLRMSGPGVDARAGLARIALIEGDLETARHQASEIEAILHNTGPLGMEFPILAYLTCARVWQSVGEKDRMQRVTSEGYTELEARMEKISTTEWQRSYLENIPEHRELMVLWREFQPTGRGNPTQ